MAEPLPFDVQKIRQDFPILATRIDAHNLIYFDNGATTQKPKPVIDAIDSFYKNSNANIHRAVHRLSQRATDLFESTRIRIQRFINAPSHEEIIFTRGTTESINLVAHSFCAKFMKAGDEILLSTLEHHSNIVPWQLAAQQHGLIIRGIPIDDNGDLRYEELPKLITDRTMLIAITHTSNALGTIIDLSQIAAQAKRVGAKVLVDGAQWVGHFPLDVQKLGVDFYAFSGHKLFAPPGSGVLWGRRELLDAMPPFMGGGDMIHTVSFEKTTFADLPNKFEAGTPDIAAVIGLGAAIDYLNSLDFSGRIAHEHRLLQHATKRLEETGAHIVGRAKNKTSIVSFVMDGSNGSPKIDPHTLGTLLDVEGIAVRTGHHCCMPLMDRLGLSGTVRASFSFYNTIEEIDQLAGALEKIKRNFSARSAPRPAYQPVPPIPIVSKQSIQQIADELVDDFNLFDNWNDRYAYIIELGEKLPKLPEAEKTEPNRVHGCQSTVFLSARKKPGTTDVLEFEAESDASIVQGLIAILTRLFSGQRASDIIAFDIEKFFDRIGINANLMMTRRNGLAAMVNRIKALAGLISGNRDVA